MCSDVAVAKMSKPKTLAWLESLYKTPIEIKNISVLILWLSSHKLLKKTLFFSLFIYEVLLSEIPTYFSTFFVENNFVFATNDHRVAILKNETAEHELQIHWGN